MVLRFTVRGCQLAVSRSRSAPVSGWICERKVRSCVVASSFIKNFLLLKQQFNNRPVCSFPFFPQVEFLDQRRVLRRKGKTDFQIRFFPFQQEGAAQAILGHNLTDAKDPSRSFKKG